METPDITKIQKLVMAGTGLVTTVLGTLVAFGAISVTEAGAVGAAYASLGSFLAMADAIIRNGRARALANPESLIQLERVKPPAGMRG